MSVESPLAPGIPRSIGVSISVQGFASFPFEAQDKHTLLSLSHAASDIVSPYSSICGHMIAERKTAKG